MPSRKEVTLTGVEAVQAIQAFTVLQILNDVLAPSVEKTLSEGYTEEIAKQMSREVFSAVAIAGQIEAMSNQLLDEFVKLTGINGEMFSVDIETMPVIKVKTIINDVEEK